MNDNTTTKKSEFIFRRLSDSFDQFTGDLWGSVPTWLLALVVLCVAARVVYRYANPAARAPGVKDPLSHWLKVAMWVSLAALTAWILVAFYNRETDHTRGTATEAVSALGSGNAAKWYTFTIGLFVLGCVFVAFMYVKDTKSVRWYWAVPLALLRMTVYAILCFVFLLPAMQTWEDTNKQSRVVILIDISKSLTDETATDELVLKGDHKAKRRIDVVIEMLTDEKIALLKGLLDKNPVAIYAFGSRLDEAPEIIPQGESAWNKAEWEAFARYDFRRFVLKGLSAEGKEQIQKSDAWKGDGSDAWVSTWFQRRETPDADLKTFSGLATDDDVKLLRSNLERLDKRIDVARTIALGTNVADSVTAAVNRESANMVQGIIVISDGRSNLGSEAGFIELRERATREKIPIFTIGVGEDRQTVAISITDVQAPSEAPIDEAWKVIVEADGVNLANKEVEVTLELFMPEIGPDGKPRAKDMTKAQPDHTLPPQKLVFTPGDPPHGQAEFVIDPADPKLPEKLTEESKDAAIKKRVLKEGKWGARARIAKDPAEAFPDAFHTRERADIDVVQRKLRILLVTGAPSREFSFLRTLLVREVQDKRATLTTFVQNDAGREGKLTPELDETVILRFPNRFELTEKKNADPAERPYNLNEYDVILAFDPDWSELSQQQAEDLWRWVHEGGGGFVYVAGPVNTFQLARVEEGQGRLVKLLELLPVVPADILVARIKATPKTPRRLYLHPERIIGSDLLKLDDKVPDDPIAGWERFFTDRDKYVENKDLKVELFPHRGFFSCYPVKDVKPGSAVLADFADETDNGEPNKLPWIVINNPSAAYRTAFLASGELYKMRVYEPSEGTGREFFERFWVKMIKYAGGKRNVKAPRGRVLVGKEAVSGAPLRVQARLLNESAKPYEPGKIDPKFKVVQEKVTGGDKREFGPFDLAPKQTAGGAFDGYYAGQVLLDAKQFPPGDFIYRVVVDVPDSPGETLSGEFRIKESNPEMDNKKPDYAALLKMASEYNESFVARLSDKTKLELAPLLPKEGGGVQKLAFKVTDQKALSLIPDCMKTEKRQTQNRGPVNDLWDKGFDMPKTESENPFVQKYFVSWWSGLRLSVVLLVVVFLLSLEWLARKLLRLA